MPLTHPFHEPPHHQLAMPLLDRHLRHQQRRARAAKLLAPVVRQPAAAGAVHRRRHAVRLPQAAGRTRARLRQAVLQDPGAALLPWAAMASGSAGQKHTPQTLNTQRQKQQRRHHRQKHHQRQKQQRRHHQRQKQQRTLSSGSEPPPDADPSFPPASPLPPPPSSGPPPAAALPPASTRRRRCPTKSTSATTRSASTAAVPTAAPTMAPMGTPPPPPPLPLPLGVPAATHARPPSPLLSVWSPQGQGLQEAAGRDASRSGKEQRNARTHRAW